MASFPLRRTMENIFASIATSLADDAEFCMLLAYAVSAEDIATFVNTLKDRLSAAHVNDDLLSGDIFSNFISFCTRRRYQHLIGPKVIQANEERTARRKERAKKHKKIVYNLGLNWKSAQCTARQTARFSTAKHIYIPRLDTPYPPRNHWVADTQDTRDMWERHLSVRRLRDKRTGYHPMHLIDYTRLAANILPGEDVFIYDSTTRLLACAVIRNFACLPGPLAWVDFVIQEAIAYRLPTRVCCLLLSLLALLKHYHL